MIPSRYMAIPLDAENKALKERVAELENIIKQINDIVYPLQFCCTDELEHKAITHIRDICGIYQKGGK